MPNSVSVFSEYDHWNGQLLRFAKYGFKRRFTLGHGREPVGVQDHKRSSASTCSNSSSMIRLIFLVSLRRWRSLPNAVIQGFFAALFSARSLSFTASVTNSRKGIPRSAAVDLARRKMGSGISRVVFMEVWSHIYGRSVNRCLLFRQRPNLQDLEFSERPAPKCSSRRQKCHQSPSQVLLHVILTNGGVGEWLKP